MGCSFSGFLCDSSPPESLSILPSPTSIERETCGKPEDPCESEDAQKSGETAGSLIFYSDAHKEPYRDPPSTLKETVTRPMKILMI